MLNLWRGFLFIIGKIEQKISVICYFCVVLFFNTDMRKRLAIIVALIAAFLVAVASLRWKILLLLPVLGIVVAVVLVPLRWKVWFYNPAESAYITPAVPSRVLLTFGDEDGNCSRNVSWVCDSVLHESYLTLKDNNDGKIEKITAAGECFRSRSGISAFYHAKLRHLMSGHCYSYSVTTDEVSSEWYSFKVSEGKKSENSFVFVGDVQDSINGVANKFLRNAFKLNPDADFLVCGGDLTERPKNDFWNETFSTLDSLGQSMPVLSIAGNHDYLKEPICKLEKRFDLTHSYFLDSKVGDEHVFTVKYGNMQIFCLDSNREFFFLHNQSDWLELQLKKSDAKWKVVVIHHPLYSIRGEFNNLFQRLAFDDLIRENGVDLVLQGHEHAYARMTNHDDDGIPITPIYTVSHCSPKNYDIVFDEKFDKFGSQSRYYQKVRTNGDSLFVSAYDAYSNALYDSVVIVKNCLKPSVLDYGKNILESINYDPKKHRKKDIAFQKRIEGYKQKHPERFGLKK